MNKLGIMLDCSRNAVMKPEKVKEFATMISDIGYNMLMLYTEDTYEISGEPFFGHMRGRYSKEELKDIDSYCQSIGIEVIPCIQTLAHLMQLKQWKRFEGLYDCNDILMIGQPEVYELIEKMIETQAECFTTRHLHLGMDEAQFVGRGRYQDVYGYRDHMEILTEHLRKVKEIAEKHGFQVMMWSDMFIRLHNNGDYYGDNIHISQETIERVPEGVELVYWDYSFKEKEHYEAMFDVHENFKNPILFAGGLWTWTGYVPNMSKTWDVLEAAILSAEEHKIDNIFFTMWGDDGKDCSFYTQLPMIYAAARMVQGVYDKKIISREFEKKYGYSFDEFMNLELPNLIEERKGLIDNPSKYLLFNDPFIGLFDYRVSKGQKEYYEKTSTILNKSINGRAYDYLFDMEKKLTDVLIYKADLGVRLRKNYQVDNKEVLRKIAESEFDVIIEKIKKFAESFRDLWLKENKPFGLEVQESRFGALLYRMEMCKIRLLQYVDGEIERIEELEETSLVSCEELELHNNWRSTITACVN